MAWYLYALLLVAGTAAGFINILAGNGSAITLPALIFIGLPANVANATNRVGVVLQNIVGLAGFQQQKRLDTRGSLLLSIPAVGGAIVGAVLAARTKPEVMQQVLAVALLMMLGMMFIDPKGWVEGRAARNDRRLTVVRFAIFFVIGIYGGYIQAGIGIFLLTALVLEAGYDIVRANAVKIAIVLLQSLASLAIFQANAQVDWGMGLVVAVGNMFGAFLATRFAVEKGAVWVRRFVIVIVAVSALYMLGAVDLITRLFGR